MAKFVTTIRYKGIARRGILLSQQWIKLSISNSKRMRHIRIFRSDYSVNVFLLLLWWFEKLDAPPELNKSRQLAISIGTSGLLTSFMAVGILQIMVNLSPDPTRPDGSELPIFSYGGEGIPRVPKQYRFSPHRYIFPKRWSNQLNQSERRIYAPLTRITTDPGNGLVSARRQAIAWTNFHFIINYTVTNTLQWFFLVVWKICI